MNIHGHTKTTLLDYPGQLATVFFTGGCNFRCPFCHNSDLVLDPASSKKIQLDEIRAFLTKRKSIITGVCITGGEPTLNSDLPDFIQEIKQMGFLVKLDTNGTNPSMTAKLIKNRTIDYVAMDIKSGETGYAKASGVPNINLDPIKETVRLLKEGIIEYEFRTTVVKGIHTSNDFYEISDWLEGNSLYFIQNYVDSPKVMLPGFQEFSPTELIEFLNIVKKKLPNSSLRGTDIS